MSTTPIYAMFIFFCWALYSGSKVTKPGIISTLYYLRLYRATHGYHVDCSGMPKILLQSSSRCYALRKSSLAHLQYLVRCQCKGMLYCVVHGARTRKLCSFLVLAQFRNIFDPQLVESTEANLLVEGCLAHTSQKHILAKEEKAWGYFFPRHLFLEENAWGLPWTWGV